MKRSLAILPVLALALSAWASVGVSSVGLFLPDDLTDLHPGTAWAPDAVSGYPGANAFDNETLTTSGRWLSTYTSAQYDRSEVGELRWTFSDGPQVVRAYRFMGHVETDEQRTPRSWILYGSNDGGDTWDALDEVAFADERPWSVAESRVYSFGNETAYSTYRFLFRATGGIRNGYYVGLQEVELFERLSPASEDITAAVDPADVSAADDLTAPGGGHVTASSGYSPYVADKLFDDDLSRDGRWLAVPIVIGTMPDLTDSFPGEAAGSASHADFPPARAFDNDATEAAGRWLAVTQSGDEKAWLQWTFSDGPHEVAGYGLKATVTPTGYEDRAPAAWTLLGSNDGGATWETVDTVSGEERWGLGEERLHWCADPAPYRTYRFSFTGGGRAGDYIGLSEVEFYSPEAMESNCTGRAWVQYVFDEPTVVDGYTLASFPFGACSPERCPTAWRLLASDDGVSWTTADRRVGEESWGDYQESRDYSFANSTAYACWRLVLDGLGVGSGEKNYYGYVGFCEMKLRRGSLPVTTSAVGESGFGAYAFDGDFESPSSGAWVGQALSGAEKAWLVYDFGTQVLVDGYGLAGMAALPARNPTAWTLSGSNNGRSWTVVDSRSGVSSWGPKVARRFDVAAPERFRFFKLALTAGTTDAGSNIGLQEIELYGSDAPAATVIVVR